MGEVVERIEIENYEDRGRCLDGLLSEDQVRRTAVEALVDTGSTMLVLPAEVRVCDEINVAT